MTNSYIAAGWRCDPSAARPDLVEVIRAAVNSIGIVEQPAGSNRGAWIDLVLSRAGVAPGSPWCASAISEWYSHATTPAPILPRMASAYKVHTWAEKRGALVSLVDLLPGDILGVFQKDNPTTPKREDFHGHVGLYVGPLADGKLATVEGNVRSACRGLVRERGDWAWAVRVLR